MCVAFRENSRIHPVHFFRITGDRDSKDLPPLPADFRNFQDTQDDDGFYQGPLSPLDAYDDASYGVDSDGRSRVPLIVLAQQGQHPPPEPSDAGVYPMRFRLSTISEKSERTEASKHWPSKQQLYAHNDPHPSPPMSSNTSYGQLIGELFCLEG